MALALGERLGARVMAPTQVPPSPQAPPVRPEADITPQDIIAKCTGSGVSQAASRVTSIQGYVRQQKGGGIHLFN
jgi:hypothetical protein